MAIWRLNSILLRLFRLSVDELEDVIEDEVLARGIAGELEGLSVAHGTLLLVDLWVRISWTEELQFGTSFW